MQPRSDPNATEKAAPVRPERSTRSERSLMRGREFPSGFALATFLFAEAVCVAILVMVL